MDQMIERDSAESEFNSLCNHDDGNGGKRKHLTGTGNRTALPLSCCTDRAG